MEPRVQKQALAIHLVNSNDSPELTHLKRALIRSSIIGLDAEWKPNRHADTFPTVALLQIACRLVDSADPDESPVFLLDLQAVHLPLVYELLRGVFASPDVIKLGFRFKQDLVYLSSTFCHQGCNPGFERIEPFIDITAIYNYLQPKQLGRSISKQNKSLATICQEVLGISLSKELQCSDWSQHPLTEEQKAYAAADAHCLLEIFNVFHAKVVREGQSSLNLNKHGPSDLDPGLKQISEISNGCNMVTRTRFCEASTMICITVPDLHSSSIQMAEDVDSTYITKQLDSNLLWIVKKHGDKILLKDTDRKPKTAKKKAKKSSSAGSEYKQKTIEIVEDWQGPPPWDQSVGGDGCPKFLCDVMVEGLAKHLRCVGIDAAIPHSKKPETRDLIDQAQKEKRVLLTRDAKILRYEYLIKNQIYRIKNLLKNDQLRENRVIVETITYLVAEIVIAVQVIETFELKISEDQLMSRCTKCNGTFIQKPLTTEEAVEAAKGFQVIPNCLFNRNLEFWQCKDCNQLYWEGTQYHNAVQKFIDVCKLNEQP
ncbi:exonuclease mut-7 homolog [Phtheirospermum japonicum]|uniref:Exonuclease mut-7 homolog n=1 Tax=Phtheirospermum japonicum TaxID=374723 RepID=A0A830BS47_9LAMI|nr:exonuclease mut-7 homolog [Phtheirospermum japonicum]